MRMGSVSIEPASSTNLLRGFATVRDAGGDFIPADDLDSRDSFTLIGALFSSVVGEVPGAKPVLTLPVN